MTPDVITANLRDGLYQTWERMYERDIRHMPVLGEGGEVVGIISDRDIRRPGFVDSPNHTHAFAIDNHIKVEDAMSEGLVTLDVDDDISKAVDLMIVRKIGALPVFEGARLAGMVSTVDVLRALRTRL